VATPPTANLVCHLDASLISGVVFDGASGDGQNIVEWTDQSGNGNHFVKTTTNLPSWKANAHNGLGAVDFDRLNAEYLENTSPFLSGAVVGHMFMVFQSTDTAGANSGWMNFGSGALEDTFTWTIGDQVFTDWGGTARHQILSVPNIRNFHLTEIKSEFNDWDFIQNGGEFVENKTTHALGWDGAAFFLGRADTLFGSFEMSEILIYSAIQTGQDLTDIYVYTSEKYGLGFAFGPAAPPPPIADKEILGGFGYRRRS